MSVSSWCVAAGQHEEQRVMCHIPYDHVLDLLGLSDCSSDSVSWNSVRSVVDQLLLEIVG
jgi:hypothetical protein